jgi:hypothetical protein
MSKILLGPVLGYEYDSANSASYYTVIVRLTATTKAPVWEVDGQTVSMTSISPALPDGSQIWRGEVALNPFKDAQDRVIPYRILVRGVAQANACRTKNDRWQFVLPGKNTPTRQPRVAFCSCNGFSDPKLVERVRPLALWEHLEKLHAEKPYTLLLMGGDQLYCDSIAQRNEGFSLWTWLNPGERRNQTPSPQQFMDSYTEQYLKSWAVLGSSAHEPMIRMMASIPSVMIWDDHDIYDGWGSYEADPSDQPYYREAFVAARQTFIWHQLRGTENKSLLDSGRAKGPRHFTQGLRFGSFTILALDNRSNRTPTQIMNDAQWTQVKNWASKNADKESTLLVISPVPLVYRRFINLASGLPGEHSLEDDLRDHWNDLNHEGERSSFVYHLFEWLHDSYKRVTLLSGDVHVGALGFLEHKEKKTEIAQIISSGIMHPPPSTLEWAGVCALSSDESYSIRAQPVTAHMTRPQGAADKFLRCRNFAWLQLGGDGKLWVNWECEQDKDKPPHRIETPLI